MDKIPESLKSARFAALDLLRDYNIYTPPVTFDNILSGEWLKLIEFIFPAQADDLAWMLDIEQKTILINKNEEDFNKSYTVAHELWHWILHKKFLEKNPEKYSIVFKKKLPNIDEDELEREANCFALNLIIPKFMLDSYIDTFWIMELSKIFWTSPLLIEKRISNEYE